MSLLTATNEEQEQEIESFLHKGDNRNVMNPNGRRRCPERVVRRKRATAPGSTKEKRVDGFSSAGLDFQNIPQDDSPDQEEEEEEDSDIHRKQDTIDRGRTKLIRAASLCFLFFLIELFAGLWSGSLAILSDSFHLLSDIAGFGISIFALYLVKKPPTKTLTFGYARAEIVGALLSTFLIWILVAFLVFEAFDRLSDPKEIDAPVMFVTALMGVGVNVVLGLTLHLDPDLEAVHPDDDDDDEGDVEAQRQRRVQESRSSSSGDELSETNAAPPSPFSRFLSQISQLVGFPSSSSSSSEPAPEMTLNVRAALIHVLGDLLSSLGVLLASLIIWRNPTWTFIDPLCTFLFSILVLSTTGHLVYTTFRIIMQSVPGCVDVEELEKGLKSLEGVVGVHSLHVWTLAQGRHVLSAHVQVCISKLGGEGGRVVKRVLKGCQDLVCEKYGIHHATFQVEPLDSDDLELLEILEGDSAELLRLHDHCIA
ncbi:hypothetical protein HDV05_006948 [Chytridiales sp. JEL 0842]|nr:hypothetical protein HDV05_006948 [Chytridiales sp. JEL 0842]